MGDVLGCGNSKKVVCDPVQSYMTLYSITVKAVVYASLVQGT